MRATAAPLLPVPKIDKWDSLVYLHGKIDDSDLSGRHLVLTSGDFGVAYLVERWASRFVGELFNHSSVLFIGYSVDDPVMRYLIDAIAAERRIDASISGLPPFLTSASGVNSGFMIAHVTAAALASENKSLAHPASVDSLPTSANQEDHVSMATFAARRLSDMADNTAAIVAIELLAAAQGIDFRRPLRSSAPLEEAHAMIRKVAPHLDGDRYLALDIEAVTPLVRNGAFRSLTAWG